MPLNQDQIGEFFVLRKGEQTPYGPYSENQLVELLNHERIRPSDLVYYPELSDWQRLSDVFDLEQEIPNLGAEGQDPKIVSAVYDFVERRSEAGEDIYFIAVQNLGASDITRAVRLSQPKSVILTNHRICVISQKLIGEEIFDEYRLEHVETVVPRMKTGQNDGIFSIYLKTGEVVEIDRIPFAQLDRLDVIAPELLAAIPQTTMSAA